MFAVRFAAIFCCFAAGSWADPIPVKLPEGPHPNIYLTPPEVADLKARVDAQPWAKAVADGIVKRADAHVDRELDIPRAGGQWTHWYTCKKDGGSLRADSPTEHRCTKCGEVYTGWPYDQVHITRQHSSNLRSLEDLGIAYALTDDPRYAEKVRAILLDYASFYRDLELHDRDGTQNSRSKARLFAQTLDEAVHLCFIAFGYDMVYDAACFTEEDHTTIADGLLRPLVETIRGYEAGISNWQTWHNAGLAGAAWLLGDAELVDWVFNGPHGVLFQMDESVMPSGMWYEESPSYHWYALRALLYTFEGAARVGMDVYDHPRARKLFDAPMRQLFPDGTFPALHDSSRSGIGGARQYYEVGYRRYGDARYAALLDRRDSEWALIWGVDTVPEDAGGALRLTRSSNERSEGLAILRTADGKSAAFLDYGPGQSGHVHPAKLNLIWYTLGDERFVDPGRLPYGNPMHAAWFKQTVAHNTVVVNGRSQRRTGGTLQAFATADDVAIVRATCDSAYDGVVLDRTLALVGDVLLDVVLCRAEPDATFDLPLHLRAELADLPAATPADLLGDRDGYQHIKDVTRFDEPLTRVHASTGPDTVAIRIFDRSQCYLGTAPGYAMDETLPVIVRRQTGQHAVFAAAYQPVSGGGSPAHVEGRLDLGNATLSVNGLTITVGNSTIVSHTDANGQVVRRAATAAGFDQ